MNDRNKIEKEKKMSCDREKRLHTQFVKILKEKKYNDYDGNEITGKYLPEDKRYDKHGNIVIKDNKLIIDLAHTYPDDILGVARDLTAAKVIGTGRKDEKLINAFIFNMLAILMADKRAVEIHNYNNSKEEQAVELMDIRKELRKIGVNDEQMEKMEKSKALEIFDIIVPFTKIKNKN